MSQEEYKCHACTHSVEMEGRTCAFDCDGGTFVSDNWNCASIDLIRRAVESEKLTVVNNEDENICCIPIEYQDYIFLVVQWYKCRGRTAGLFLIDDQGLAFAPTEADVKKINEQITEYL